ncbi:MAG: MOSC domain-containing protein [Acidimicrobiales bacterium]
MGQVIAVHRSDQHDFSKQKVETVELVAGVGVAGDVHAGSSVQHRSRVALDPGQPNLRQVHLLASEVLESLAGAGPPVAPGDLGENITTSGIDLHALGVGTVLRIGESALVAVTGLRNPCAQIDDFRPGLLRQLRYRDDDGVLVRRAGIMGVVVLGGVVSVGDGIEASAPPGPHRPLDRV